MAIFTGFKPTGLQKIANKLGYEGSLDNFENYLEQNPEKKRQMIVYEESAKQMARGGVVKMQEGGVPTQSTPSFTPAGQAYVTTLGEPDKYLHIGDVISSRCYRHTSTDRCNTVGPVTQPQLTPVMQEQMISDAGQVRYCTCCTYCTGYYSTSRCSLSLLLPHKWMDAQGIAEQVQDFFTGNQAAQDRLNRPKSSGGSCTTNSL